MNRTHDTMAEDQTPPLELAAVIEIATPEIDAPTDWTEHEHQAPALHVAAIRLLREAGTLGLAIQALETTDRLTKDREAFNLALARGCGHDSFAELVGASQTVATNADSPWYLTRLPNGRWMAWNKNCLRDIRDFNSQEAAEQFCQAQAS